MIAGILVVLLATNPLTDESFPESNSWAFQLGGRTSASFGDYVAPGLGGFIRVEPTEWFGVELFSDHSLEVGGFRQSDHVIGFSAYSPSLWSGPWGFVSPTGGLCVDFRWTRPDVEDAPSATDILFGAHAGLVSKIAIDRHWAFDFFADGYLYSGHESGVEGWSAELSNELEVSLVARAGVGLSLTL